MIFLGSVLASGTGLVEEALVFFGGEIHQPKFHASSLQSDHLGR